MRECIHHAPVHLALERNDQVRKVAHRLPAPFDEFRLVAADWMQDIDLALVAGETQRVPFLRLAAKASLPGLLCDLWRQIVMQPFGNLAELVDGTDARLLRQLAQRGR